MIKLVVVALSILAAIAISVIETKDSYSKEVEIAERDFQHEVNLHYSNVAVTGLQDDKALQTAIDRVKEALQESGKDADLIIRVEEAYPKVSNQRCPIQSQVASCRRYYEAVQPFIHGGPV